MSIIRPISLLFFIMIVGMNQALALTLYRHLPFSMTLQRGDELIVNYDFQGKHGIACQANSNDVAIDFHYKGRLKTDFLPLYLESDHVPDNESEVLSDQKGQFSLRIDPLQTLVSEVEVHCDYIS